MQAAARNVSIALLLITLSAATGIAQPAADTLETETEPAAAALQDGSVVTSHCGPNESRIEYGDTHYCQYNPPCDGTCTETEQLIVD